jgi:site-specific DNA-methyltransferase (adenine-specific)
MKLLLGDCLDKLKELEDNSVDSIVTDPPYGLSAAPNSGKSSKGGFMGKQWDYDVPSVDIWKECLRVLKPGGHLLAFAGTRTYHRMAVRIEDAGFEIRDMISWLYGSGFPKSMDISKQIDKKLEDTELSQKLEGWGTALKPAHEPVVMARNPLEENTVVDNVLKYGTGGINIDGSRISTDETITNHSRSSESAVSKGKYGDSREQDTHQTDGQKLGRFPANIILDEEAGKILDEQSGLDRGAAAPVKRGHDGSSNGIYGDYAQKGDDGLTFRGDTGGASRFFYCPKVSKRERNEGGIVNNHITVKPVDLMLYLIRLVTPKGGVTLDPFMGSGSTGKAAVRGGFDFIGIEREEEYFEIAEARIEYEENKSGIPLNKKVEVKPEVVGKLNEFFG